MMIFLTLLVLVFSQVRGVDFHDFGEYQNRLTQEEVEKKITTYLKKDPAVSNFYWITDGCLYIGDVELGQIDYKLSLAEAPIPMRPRAKKSLRGARIAIDPGHFGGALAELEERFIAIPKEQTSINQPISFNEGTLTYLTASALKDLLESEGAEVFITRPGIGYGAIKLGFFEWLREQPQLWKSNEKLSQLFRKQYNRVDLLARAQAINAFKPDSTIMIHYNDHPPEQNRCFSEANYSLVFIPGSFTGTELNRVEDRYEFLRLIVTDDVEQSLDLSRCMANQFVDQLKVPLISPDMKTNYLEPFCLYQEPGIYSRNLALTRLVHGPLCYGETLIQNNESEALRLAKNDSQVAGMPAPSRVKEVAQAYYLGIKKYFE